jgi:hypothetical protein
MASTQYNLAYEIHDPNLYRRVNLDDLKPGTSYRYCFTKSTYPQCVTVLTNEGDNLTITSPVFSGSIQKSSVQPRNHIFYEKTSNALYPRRENYLKLAEGLSLTQARSPDPQSRYLFDDPNIMKEISTYQNNGGKKSKKSKKSKKAKTSKKRVIGGAKRKGAKKTSRR